MTNPTPLATTVLSARTRVAHVALLLVSSAMGVGLLALWLTEPALPARTHLAFAVMTTIAASWVAYAWWVLVTRHVLFARQRVVAASMSVAFSAAFVLSALAIGLTTASPAGLVGAALGLPLFAVALLLLGRARRAYAHLLERRTALAAQMGTRPD